MFPSESQPRANGRQQLIRSFKVPGKQESRSKPRPAWCWCTLYCLSWENAR